MKLVLLGIFILFTNYQLFDLILEVCVNPRSSPQVNSLNCAFVYRCQYYQYQSYPLLLKHLSKVLWLTLMNYWREQINLESGGP